MTKSNRALHPCIIGFVIGLCFNGCTRKNRSVEDPDKSSASGLRDFFSKHPQPPKQTIKLTSGQEVDLKTYRMSEKESHNFLLILKRHAFYSEFEGKKLKDDVLQLAEMFALSEYTQRDYELFKSYMDGSLFWKPDGSPTAVTKEKIELTETSLLSTVSAINKLPKFTGPVYFGACMSSNYIDALWKNKQVLTNLNFTSTSALREKAMKFSYCSDGAGYPKDYFSYLFVVEKATLGASIGNYSSYWAEREVLYLPKSSFTIKSIERKDDEYGLGKDYSFYEVKLDEVDGIKK